MPVSRHFLYQCSDHLSVEEENLFNRIENIHYQTARVLLFSRVELGRVRILQHVRRMVRKQDVREVRRNRTERREASPTKLYFRLSNNSV